MIPSNPYDDLDPFEDAPLLTLPGDIRAEADWPGADIPDDVEAWAWRISAPERSEPTFRAWWDLFVRDVDTSRVRRLVIGEWETGYEDLWTATDVIELLVRDADLFPSLEVLFLGDPAYSEVSAIQQGDVTPLLEAFPALKALGVRGSTGLVLRPTTHTALRELTFQTSGLPPAVVRAVAASNFPALTHLELYLGNEAYDSGSPIVDVARLLATDRLPNLRHLGLRNTDDLDAVAAVLAHAPIVAWLEVLDLSLGTFGDETAAVLLAGQPLNHLKKLDLHHHFVSPPMEERLRQAWPDVEIDLHDRNSLVRGPDLENTANVWRYIAIHE